MLVRYITLGQVIFLYYKEFFKNKKIKFHQLPTALYCLRKIGDKIIDKEWFEKECGIGIELFRLI